MRVWRGSASTPSIPIAARVKTRSRYPKELLDNLARNGLAEVVGPNVMTSEEAAASIAGPIELLLIDGDHAYQAVRCDAELSCRG